MTQLFTSLVGSQASKGGALENPARRESDWVIIPGEDSLFYREVQPKSPTCACAQLLSFHRGKPQDVYFAPFEKSGFGCH